MAQLVYESNKYAGRISLSAIEAQAARRLLLNVRSRGRQHYIVEKDVGKARQMILDINYEKAGHKWTPMSTVGDKHVNN